MKKTGRKIPATMVSQHPDHARRPYWHNQEFISTQEEAKECFLSFSDLKVSEYKWDWEGKLVDESVVERLLGEHLLFFKKHPLGQEKFLTFRLPNPKVETEFRLGRAFMGLLSAAGLARQIGFEHPPIFEVILPMTETAQEIIAIQEAFQEIASLKHPLYNFEKEMMKHIEVIPLFEQVETIMNSHRLLFEYLELHRQRFGHSPGYLRPYLARSDPALNSGLVPTVLAVKIALSYYRDFEKTTGIRLFPIIGSGSLPFRGGLTPEKTEEFLQEYRGIKTALLQGAFRYDYTKTKVINAIDFLEKNLPKGEASQINSIEEKRLKKVIAVFTPLYRRTVEEIAPLVNQIARHLPRRRERVQHIGLFGYSRGVGRVKLPRAIGFTASLYSLGVPPEIIGAGRGIKQAKKTGELELLEKYYLHLRTDLRRAGRFVNREKIIKLSRRSAVWSAILEDVVEVEKYLGEELSPLTREEKEHLLLTEMISEKLERKVSPTELINRTAILRKSLG